MIAPETVLEIRRHLAEGKLSQRRIARLMKVSRGTVGAVASGKRPDYKKRRPNADSMPTGPPRRCPDCGGMVLMPCHGCQTRRTMAARDDPLRRPLRRSLRRRHAMFDKPFGLELHGNHQVRYEDVRLCRLLLAGAEETPSDLVEPSEENMLLELDAIDLRDAFDGEELSLYDDMERDFGMSAADDAQRKLQAI